MSQSIPTQAWISFDWRAAELCKLSLFSKDAQLRDALQLMDVHSFVASQMLELNPSDLPYDTVIKLRQKHPDVSVISQIAPQLISDNKIKPEFEITDQIREASKTCQYAALYSGVDLNMIKVTLKKTLPYLSDEEIERAAINYANTLS